MKTIHYIEFDSSALKDGVAFKVYYDIEKCSDLFYDKLFECADEILDYYDSFDIYQEIEENNLLYHIWSDEDVLDLCKIIENLWKSKSNDLEFYGSEGILPLEIII